MSRSDALAIALADVNAAKRGYEFWENESRRSPTPFNFEQYGYYKGLIDAYKDMVRQLKKVSED